MRLYLNFILIYLISHSKWILVESSDLAGSYSSGAVATPGTDGTTVQAAGNDQQSSTTLADPSGQPSSTSSDAGTASSISQSGEDSENQASKAAEGGSVSEGSDSTSTRSSAGTPPAKTGVDLDITSESSTNEFEYKKDGQYVTYTAKGDNAFKLVKDGTTEVWKTVDSSEYSLKVELDLMNKDAKAIIIYFDDNKTKVLKNDAENDLWIAIDTTKVNPCSLNINYSSETYLYKNECKNNVRTFTARSGFAFKCANEYIDGNKVEIWKTNNETEYGNKIEIDLMNDDAKVVTVYFVDKKTMVLKKDGKNEPWNEIDTSKVNPKSIDITDTKETYFYSNKLDKNVRTFTAKKGFAFNDAIEFIDDNKVEIWKADKESEYVNKIDIDLMNNDSKAVTVFQGDDKTRLFIKENANDTWKEIDVTKVNPKSMDITDDKETYVYSNMLQGSTRTFTAKKGFSFNIVNEIIDCNKVEIWKADKENEYSNKIEVDLMNKDSKAVTVFLGDNKNKIYMKSGKNDPWKEIDTTNVNPEEVNIDYPCESYFYKHELNGYYRTFTAKTGFAIKGAHEYVNKKKVEIWTTSNESEYANKIEVDSLANDGKAVTLYLNDDRTKVFKKDGKNDSWNEIDLSKVNPKPVNINYPHQSYFYTNELKGETRTFTAKEGFMFNHARFFPKNTWVDIWKTDNESEYANKIEVEGAKKVTIYLADGSTKVIEKGSDGKWPVDTSGQGTGRGPSGEEVASTGTDQSGSRANASGEGKMAEGSDSTSSGSPADGSTNKTGVDLNIKSDKKSNKNLEYEKVGEYATYTAKDNYAFKLVKEDGTNIWEATNATEYSIKVEVDLMVESKVVTIFLSENKTKVFKKDVENDRWTEFDTSKVNAMSININYPYETYFYKHELNGSYRTFTAKTGFAIKGAHEYVNKKKVEVWNTDNENEYVDKIEVDLMNNDAKAVTVYMAGNKTRVFKKDGMSEPWKEIDTNNVNPKPVNINYPYECYFYQNKLQDNFRTFTAKKGFAFKNVIEYINNIKIEIWKADQDSEYVNKIDIDLMNNDSKAVTFYMRNNTTRIFMRSGMNGAWNEIDTTKVNAKSVNIQYTYDCHYYINSLDNDVRTFTAKKGFMFNHARCFVDNDWLDIWKTDNESEYANKIEVEGAKKVTIYLADGSTKVIEKGSDGKWPVDTSGQGTGRGPSLESTSS
ncbi:hypothetical protein MACJ_003908 [Theileria orientalis]|uniref:SfiI-subtelomeric related protein family member n=1 Tax=Theileria orientalis TaxID=68886 RepID=A0A976XKF8_THEOR|nr:hypothetical protein MACJ_003908 [Theileria orientalis]